MEREVALEGLARPGIVPGLKVEVAELTERIGKGGVERDRPLVGVARLLEQRRPVLGPAGPLRLEPMEVAVVEVSHRIPGRQREHAVELAPAELETAGAELQRGVLPQRQPCAERVFLVAPGQRLERRVGGSRLEPLARAGEPLIEPGAIAQVVALGSARVARFLTEPLEGDRGLARVVARPHHARQAFGIRLALEVTAIAGDGGHIGEGQRLPRERARHGGGRCLRRVPAGAKGVPCRQVHGLAPEDRSELGFTAQSRQEAGVNEEPGIG